MWGWRVESGDGFGEVLEGDGTGGGGEAVVVSLVLVLLVLVMVALVHHLLFLLHSLE